MQIETVWSDDGRVCLSLDCDAGFKARFHRPTAPLHGERVGRADVDVGGLGVCATGVEEASIPRLHWEAHRLGSAPGRE